ncbi:MAG: phosphotransferase [Paracoccaceae bacterium]
MRGPPSQPVPPVRAALRDAGLLPPGAALAPLGGGRTNVVWRFASGEGDLVAKLYLAGPGNPLFPNDAAAEGPGRRHLRGAGLAPDRVAMRAAAGRPLLVYRHVAGPRGCTDAAQAAALLRRLHGTPAPPPALRRAASDAPALLAAGHAILDLCPGRDANRLRRLAPRISADDAAPPPACLIHGDVTPGNLVRGPDGLRLIDWQCPAIGDPVEDVALFLSPAMQTVHGGGPLPGAQRSAFLGALMSQPLAARYRRLAPLFHWRMAAYCLWKVARGDASYRAGQEAETRALDACVSEQH